MEDLKYSHHASSYTTPEEIEAIIAALRQAWKDLAGDLARAKQEAGVLCQRNDETKTQYLGRYFAMTEPEKERAEQVACIEDRRRGINRAIKMLRADEIPGPQRTDQGGNEPPLASLLANFDAAHSEAYRQRERQIEATPIDDAAWEQELERRRRIELYLAGGHMREIA
jgi:hypothetical protein